MDKNNDKDNLNMKNSGNYQGSGGGGGQGKGGPGPAPNAPRFDKIIIYIVIGLLVTMLLNGLMSRMLGSGEKEISYTQFMEKVKAGDIQAVNIQDDRIIALASESDDTPFNVSYYAVGYSGQDPDLIKTLEQYDVDTSIAVSYTHLDVYKRQE